jgi:hypothetical protein
MDVIGPWCQLNDAAGVGLRRFFVLEVQGEVGQVRRSQMEKAPESDPEDKR